MNDTPRIVATVGLCGSGKSVLCERLEKRGYAKVYFGGLTIAELKQRGLPITPDNEKTVREELRRTHGMAAFAVLSLPIIDGFLNEGRRVLIDGLYSFAEYKVLQEKFGADLVVVAVFTPPALRYARLAARPVRPLTIDEARKRDFAEIENIEKGGPIAIADLTLVNDGPVDNLLSQIDRLFP